MQENRICLTEHALFLRRKLPIDATPDKECPNTLEKTFSCRKVLVCCWGCFCTLVSSSSSQVAFELFSFNGVGKLAALLVASVLPGFLYGSVRRAPQPMVQEVDSVKVSKAFDGL